MTTAQRIQSELYYAHLMGERPTIVILGLQAWRQLPSFILDRIFGLQIQVAWHAPGNFIEVQ